MPDASDGWVVLARAPRAREAEEIVYGLKLRSIRARAARPGRREHTGGWAVEVPPDDLDEARRALGFILEGMREAPAVFAPSACPFCDYALRGLPPGSRCPECGNDPWSDAARERSRERGLA